MIEKNVRDAFQERFDDRRLLILDRHLGLHVNVASQFYVIRLATSASSDFGLICGDHNGADANLDVTFEDGPALDRHAAIWKSA